MSTLRFNTWQNTGGTEAATASEVSAYSFTESGLRPISSATFTAASAVSFPAGTFTTDYTKYHVVFTCRCSVSGATLGVQANASGSPLTGSNYYGFTHQVRLNTSVVNTAATSHSLMVLNAPSTLQLQCMFAIDVIDPANASNKTAWHGTYFGHNTSAQYDTGATGCGLNIIDSCDGFTMTPSTGTITGEYSVYAYV